MLVRYCNTEKTSTSNVKFRRKIQTKKKTSLFAIKGCDLEAKASVITVNSHDRTVVQVSDQASGHLATGLLHQITSLREEILTLPAG